MSPSRLLFYSLPLLLCILISNYSAKSEDPGNNYGYGSIVPPPNTPCNNCSICQYTCHNQPPPPPGATPPTPPADPRNCPPAAPVVCCGGGGGGGGGQYYSPPAPFYYPYNNYSATPRLAALSYSSALPFTFSFHFVLLFIYF